ncbi:MAG TPA: sigma-70 family RNA polymerase sigma factor [Pyrinomonadaceae bacterium]|nr:sigma-70 family RNA polymerase sigma factor [Pyrinomonadaceae bacterium]
MTKSTRQNGEPSPEEITGLLLDWGKGDKAALDRVIPLVYQELRRLAHRQMRRERAGDTLQTTALINEAYLRLVDYTRVRPRDRAHFFAIAAQAMRRILIERARSRRSSKRGSGAQRVSLDERAEVSDQRAADLVALDEALTNLAVIDPRKAQTVELRYFGGMTIEETAEVLEVSTPTVERDWHMAKIWLHREISKTA